MTARRSDPWAVGQVLVNPEVRSITDSDLPAPDFEIWRAMGAIADVIEGAIASAEPARAASKKRTMRERPAPRPTRSRRSSPAATLQPEVPQLRSEEYRAAVGAPPSFLVRSGSIVTAVVLLALMIVASVVPYPSGMGGRVHLVSAQPSVTLVSRGTGRIGLLATHDGQKVKRDDILAVIDDGSDFNHLLELDRWLAGVPPDLSEGHALPTFPNLPPSGLGSATAPMLQVRQSLAELSSFRATTAAADQVAQLRLVANSYAKLGSQVRDKNSAAGPSPQAQQPTQAGHETQVARGLAAKATLDKSGKPAQRPRDADAFSSKQREIGAPLASYRDRDSELTGRLTASLRELRSVMMEWERINVIRATQAGRVRLFGIRSELQNLRSGDTFAVIEPVDPTPTAFVVVPAVGFDKIRPGQRATIRLDSYSYHAFGLVEAKVAAVGDVAGGQCRVLLDLPYGLRLSRGRTIRFSHDLEGEARIDVDRPRLIQQLLPGLLAPARQDDATPLFEQGLSRHFTEDILLHLAAIEMEER